MMELKQAISDFLLEQQFRGNTEKTVSYYDNCLNQFARFASWEIDLDDLTIPLLRNYHAGMVERKLSSNSIQSYIRALRSFLTWCFDQEYMAVNLPERFKLPKAKRMTIDILTDTEIRRLFSCFNLKRLLQLRDYCICSLMLDSGLRMNEVVTLRVPMLKLSEGYAIVDGKGNKQRIVPLGIGTRRVLSRYLSRRPPIAETDYLFLMSDLRPISVNTVKQLFRKLKKRANIPRLRSHLLRHTFATLYLENGGDIYALQQILGHTSLEMVKRYVHTTRRKLIPKFSEYSPMDNLF